jgi:hypothetical protein
LDYGIQKEKIYHLLPTQMQIGQVVLMIDVGPWLWKEVENKEEKVKHRTVQETQ